MTDDIYVHVGLQKAGSTFLQKNIFPKLDVYYSKYRNIFDTPIKSNCKNLFSGEK